ncbi:MAG: hypothetical protein JWN29_3801, partial [Acidimicrobiales bacterium]|nr:hypothetical protein [Acidimicrobiales bacterium]
MHASREGSPAHRAGVRLVLAIAIAVAAVAGLAVTAHATDCADGGPCALGDLGPGGGTVFFVKAVGPFAANHLFPDPGRPGCEHDNECSDRVTDVSLTAEEQAALPFDYLEVAPASAEANKAWSEGPGGHSHIDVPGASFAAVGTGAGNTAAILAALPSDSPPNDSPAAHYTDAYTHNSRSDWFLPSTDELKLLLVVKQTLGNEMGTFAPQMLPSTQVSDVEIRALSMVDGGENGNYKSVSYGVRPIRAFSVTVTDETTTSTSTTTTTVAAPATPAPVPTTTPTTIAAPGPDPVAPVAPPTAVPGGFSAGNGSSPSALMIRDGLAVSVPLPPDAPRQGLAASAAIDAGRSIAVTPDGKVWSTDPADGHGQ